MYEKMVVFYGIICASNDLPISMVKALILYILYVRIAHKHIYHTHILKKYLLKCSKRKNNIIYFS